MRTEPVEILSDATNAAIMRHPGRKFPGVLVQGDTLYSMCRRADEACRGMDAGSDAHREISDLRNQLWKFLMHYKVVLGQHGLPLPFFEDRA